MIYIPNTKLIASGSRDKTIKVWNYETGECLNTLEGHSSWIKSLAHIENTKLIVSGSGDRTINIWDYESSECTRTLEGHTNEVNSVI